MQHFNKESHTHISTFVSWNNYKNRIKFHGKHLLTFLFSPLCDANLWTAPDSDQYLDWTNSSTSCHGDTDQSRRVDTEDSRVNRLKNVAAESTPSPTAGKNSWETWWEPWVGEIPAVPEGTTDDAASSCQCVTFLLAARWEQLTEQQHIRPRPPGWHVPGSLTHGSAAFQGLHGGRQPRPQTPSHHDDAVGAREGAEAERAASGHPVQTAAGGLQQVLRRLRGQRSVGHTWAWHGTARHPR